MKLKILELIEYFHADQIANNNTPFSSEDYNEAIAEVEKLVIERNTYANMGMAAPAKEEPQDEIVHVVSFVLQDQHEKEFCANCYLAATATNAYGNPPEFIADRAILELRKRQEKSDE